MRSVAGTQVRFLNSRRLCGTGGSKNQTHEKNHFTLRSPASQSTKGGGLEGHRDHAARSGSGGQRALNADADLGGPQHAAAKAVTWGRLANHGPHERGVLHRYRGDGLVQFWIETLSRGVDSLDAIAGQYPFELSAYDAHSRDERRVAGRLRGF